MHAPWPRAASPFDDARASRRGGPGEGGRSPLQVTSRGHRAHLRDHFERDDSTRRGLHSYAVEVVLLPRTDEHIGEDEQEQQGV